MLRRPEPPDERPDLERGPRREKGPRHGERLRREHRLRRRSDFLRCYRLGRRRRGSSATLHFIARPVPAGESSMREQAARLGITASRKVGKAVSRHLLKRRVREIFRRFEGRADLGPVDIVVHLWPAAGQASFSGLRYELEGLLAPIASERPGARTTR